MYFSAYKVLKFNAYFFFNLKRQLYIIKCCVIHNYNFPKRFHLHLAISARLKNPKKTKDPNVLKKKLPSKVTTTYHDIKRLCSRSLELNVLEREKDALPSSVETISFAHHINYHAM